jgi:hypothetical protein
MTRIGTLKTHSGDVSLCEKTRMELKFVIIMQTKVLPEPQTAQLVTWFGQAGAKIKPD